MKTGGYVICIWVRVIKHKVLKMKWISGIWKEDYTGLY